jgi:hypothetical protein
VTIKKDPRGGKREGAGRKPRVQEIRIIEQMDTVCVPEEIWRALLYKCQQGDTAALKLWLSYRFGLPKQQIDVTTNGENIAPPISWLNKEIEFKDVDTIDYDPVDTIQGLESVVIQGLESLDNEGDM